MDHIQLPDVGHSGLHPHLHGNLQLSDDPDPRRLLAHSEESLYLSWKQHVLYCFCPVGYSRSQEDVWAWRDLQRALVVFPRWRSLTHPVLLPSQEVQDSNLLPRSNFLGRWAHLGTIQHDKRLARRPGRLPLQSLYQETFPRLVVQV